MAAHTVVIGAGVVGAVVFFCGLSWRPRAAVAVASALVYTVMAFRLFVAARWASGGPAPLARFREPGS